MTTIAELEQRVAQLERILQEIGRLLGRGGAALTPGRGPNSPRPLQAAARLEIAERGLARRKVET